MFHNHPEEKKKAVIKSISIGNIARTEEIAKAIMLLSSEDSDYITGDLLEQNGGVLMNQAFNHITRIDFHFPPRKRKRNPNPRITI
jgi:hypothetical protein